MSSHGKSSPPSGWQNEEYQLTSAQYATHAADGIIGHHRRAQSSTASRRPRRYRMVAHARPDKTRSGGWMKPAMPCPLILIIPAARSKVFAGSIRLRCDAQTYLSESDECVVIRGEQAQPHLSNVE
jgi:hypothetical protein